jgi:acetylornithine aminotransferase
MSDTLAPAAPAPEALALDELEAFAPLYPLPRLELVSGRGATVTAADGRRYLDFVSGIAVNALGHAPPAVARVVARQARTLVHVSNLFANPPARAFAKRLLAATGYDRLFLCNSGTEAVEAALKFARAHAAARAGTSSPSAAASTGGPRSRCRRPGTRPTASRSSRWSRACASPTSTTSPGSTQRWMPACAQ